jgi:2-keto-4-pentenoate hydratase
MSMDRQQRAIQYLVALRSPGPDPRPVGLPADIAPRTESEAYELQLGTLRALKTSSRCWKVAMNDEHSGTCAPVLATDLYPSGAHVSSPIVQRLGIEPEIAFSLRRALAPLAGDRRYAREEVVDAIAAAHAAIEIVVSRFHSHETASALDRLADNISNGGLVVGPPCEDWRKFDLGTLPLRVTIRAQGSPDSTHESRGGHPLADPLLPLIWLVNHCSQRGTGMQEGDIVTTGSYAGLRYVGRGAHALVRFEGLGAAELYS